MRSNDNVMLLTTISAGAYDFLDKNIHVLLIVYVFILKVLTNFTKNTSDISCEHTCSQNYATFNHHIVSICRSMALIFVTSFSSLWQPSYISDAIRLQMRLNKH